MVEKSTIDMDLLLKRGKFLFSIGVILFFSGITYIGLLTSFGNSSVFTSVGFGMSVIFTIIGLPLLLMAGAVLFKNRRII